MFADLDKDLNTLRLRLEEYGRSLFDLRPVMPEVEQVLLASVDRNFRAGGRYMVLGNGEFAGGDQKWQKSKATKDGRTTRRSGGRTLEDTGALAASPTAQWGDDYIVLVSALAYAAIQHYGGTIHHPGGTPYIVLGDGRAQFLRKDGEYPAGVQFTKPHDITIPEHPYLVIQEEDFDEIAYAIADYLNGK